jgi:hypothetical protein
LGHGGRFEGGLFLEVCGIGLKRRWVGGGRCITEGDV